MKLTLILRMNPPKCISNNLDCESFLILLEGGHYDRGIYAKGDSKYSIN